MHPRVTTPSPAFRLLRLSGESPFQPPPATSFTKKQKTNTKKAQPLASMLWGLLQELCPLTPWPCMKPTPHMQPSQRTLQAGWVISFHQFLAAGLLVSRLLPEISARIQNSVLLPRSPALARTSSNTSGPPGPLHHSYAVLEHQSKLCILVHYLAPAFASATELELRDDDLVPMLLPCTQTLCAGLVYGPHY